MVSTPADPSRNLRAFREKFYRCASLRAEALFELTDAILTSGTVFSPPHLSLPRLSRTLIQQLLLSERYCARLFRYA
jgi:hypothetical protein